MSSSGKGSPGTACWSRTCCSKPGGHSQGPQGAPLFSERCRGLPSPRPHTPVHLCHLPRVPERKYTFMTPGSPEPASDLGSGALSSHLFSGTSGQPFSYSLSLHNSEQGPLQQPDTPRLPTTEHLQHSGGWHWLPCPWLGELRQAEGLCPIF